MDGEVKAGSLAGGVWLTLVGSSGKQPSPGSHGTIRGKEIAAGLLISRVGVGNLDLI